MKTHIRSNFEMMNLFLQKRQRLLTKNLASVLVFMKCSFHSMTVLHVIPKAASQRFDIPMRPGSEDQIMPTDKRVMRWR